MFKALLSASFLQYSGIIGSGIFVLPFIFYSSNFSFSTLLLLLSFLVVLIINFFYAGVILRTPGDHQFSGYAKIHLGPFFGFLAAISLITIGFGALTAYLKLFSSFLSGIFPFLSGWSSPVLFLLLLFIFHLLSPLIFKKLTGYISFFILSVSIFLFVVSLFYPPVDLNRFPPQASYFGALIFALNGFTIIPEVEELLRLSHRRSLLSLSSFFGVSLALLTYLLFSYSIIRLSGASLTDNSAGGLLLKSPALGILLMVFGLLATFKASLNFLNVFKEFFQRDLGIDSGLSRILSFLFPLLSLQLFGSQLILIISITGSFGIMLAALIISHMHYRLRPGLLSFILSLFLVIVFTSALVSAL